MTEKQKEYKLILQTLSMVLEGKNQKAVLWAVELAEEAEDEI